MSATWDNLKFTVKESCFSSSSSSIFVVYLNRELFMMPFITSVYLWAALGSKVNLVAFLPLWHQVLSIKSKKEIAQATIRCLSWGGERCSKLLGFVFGNKNLHIKVLNKTLILFSQDFPLKFGFTMSITAWIILNKNCSCQWKPERLDVNTSCFYLV